MATSIHDGLLDGIRRSPIAVLAAGVMVGQALAGGGWTLPPWLEGALATAAVATMARASYRRAGLAMFAALLGMHHVQWSVRPPAQSDNILAQAPGAARLAARVAAAPLLSPPRRRVVLDVESVERGGRREAVRGKVLLTVAHARREWRKGDRLEATLRLKRPRNFGNPGEFDYAGYLARRGIFVTAFLYDDAAVTLLPALDEDRGWLERWRARVAAVFARSATSPSREILAALILGAQESVPAEVWERFAIAGVSHVLSISGLHVAMVGGAGFACIRWLLGRSRWLLLETSVPKLSAAGALVPVVGYGLLASGGVATWRAVIMMAVFVAAVLCDRQRDLLLSIAAAALCVSLIWPGAVLDVSFQLSFASVTALVVGLDRAGRWWRARQAGRLAFLGSRWRRWLGAGLAYVAVTVVATLGTAPLTAWHFNRISIVGVVANPIVVPLLGSAAVGAGLLAAVAALVWEPAAAVLTAAAAVCVDLGVRAVDVLAALPGAAVRTVTPSPLELGLIYAALWVAAVGGRYRGWMLAAAGAALLGDASWEAWRRNRSEELRVSFLSVGQGDSTVVRFPTGEVMVVDGGGLPGLDTGERVVGPYLWRSKIARLDFLVVTHAQLDHYGGLAFLAREFRPREFWSNGETPPADSYRALTESAAAAGARQVVVRRGEVRRVGDCEISVLWPPREAAARSPQPNDASIVLRIRCGAAVVLLPGDIESAAEAALVAGGAPLSSTILKAAHHGSATSGTEAFVRAVDPKAVVISAGYGNRFGFPSPAVIERYARRGGRIFRTDLDGAVTIEAGRDGGWRALLGPGEGVARHDVARTGVKPVDDVAHERGLQFGR